MSVGIPTDGHGSYSCHLCDYSSDDPGEIIRHWNHHIDEACFDLAIKQVHYEMPPPRHLRLVKS